MKPERRFVRVMLDDLAILGMFDAPHKYISRAVLKALPEGYEVRSVHADWMSRQFGFIVFHPSFDVVPDGEMIPNWQGDCQLEVVTCKVVAPVDEPAFVTVG